jgi:penicillin-binding protein 2
LANELNTNGFYTFDDQLQEQALLHDERPRLQKRMHNFLRSRHALLAVVFILAGSMIFYSTAALQLSSSAAATVSETTGVSRQLIVPANRGDIIDAAGVPLAYSKSINVLYLSYASLDSTRLNSMLLDLSKYLDENKVNYKSDLTDYFTLNHDACGHAPGEEEDCGQPVFLKDDAETLYWQTDTNLFGLIKENGNEIPSMTNKLIKLDPDLFFDYLRYKYFEIEDLKADGQLFTKSDAFRIMKLRYLIAQNYWAFINGKPVELARDVSDDFISKINEQNFRFRGVLAGNDSKRVYTSSASYMSHVLGYTGRISSSQYDDLRTLGYAADAIIGQSGVEASAERYLAGKSGAKPYNIWSFAGEEGTFFSELIGSDPIPGANVRLTLDLKLQKIAVDSLSRVIDEIRNSPNNKNKGDADAGSVVMLDVRTGEVLVMASYPNYDPNDFILQSTDDAAMKRVQSYLTDKTQKPMWNRAMMEIYAPGSTFKAVTSVAALESNTITPASNTIRCLGHETIGEWPWKCLEYPGSGHGNLTLVEALATSCNMYFYNLGFRTGIDQINKYGKLLGLGEYTGIDLPGESKGFRSSRETKVLLRANPSDQIWFPADTCQTAIGQFDNSFTILQLGVYTAALATGKRVTPHVISSITRNDGTIVQNDYQTPKPIGLKESTLKAIREGMVASTVVKEGTAAKYFKDYPIKVAAKTGTAETGKEDVSSSNGLFICYAPADNPQVAIAQIVEKGAWGSNTIGIAKSLLDAYFGLTVVDTGDPVSAPGIQ